jgi:colanic acid/amylovoran biosynthesis glycosyltransferase
MANDLRIGYLVSQYPAISHTFILREVQALRALGLSIAVASVNPVDRAHAHLTAEEQDEAAKTLYIKSLAVWKIVKVHFAMLGRNPVQFFKALAFSIRLGGADIERIVYCLLYFAEACVVADWMMAAGLRHLHVHFATPAATVGLIASRLNRCGLSITVHGPDEFYDVSKYQLQVKIDGSAFVCAIGSFARSQLMKVSGVHMWSKFEITPLGVDAHRFSRVPTERDDTFEILCVGRLVPSKGQHILLMAIRELMDRGIEVRARLVGDGPDRKSLEQSARDLGLAARVHFEGSINQDRIRSFYNRADAFVLPSFAEGIPVVLMEAMAMQLPCVTTRITGIPELIRDGIDGLLVAPSDALELANAIQQLVNDPDLREALGTAARERVVANYDLSVNTRRLADVFRSRLGMSAPC